MSFFRKSPENTRNICHSRWRSSPKPVAPIENRVERVIHFRALLPLFQNSPSFSLPPPSDTYPFRFARLLKVNDALVLQRIPAVSRWLPKGACTTSAAEGAEGAEGHAAHSCVYFHTIRWLAAKNKKPKKQKNREKQWNKRTVFTFPQMKPAPQVCIYSYSFISTRLLGLYFCGCLWQPKRKCDLNYLISIFVGDLVMFARFRDIFFIFLFLFLYRQTTRNGYIYKYISFQLWYYFFNFSKGPGWFSIHNGILFNIFLLIYEFI